MLFPEQELWTGNNFAGLVECFNEEQLTDERSFEEKLKTQLDGAPSQQVRLIADLIAVHYLFVTSVGGRRKRELVHQALHPGPPPSPSKPRVVPHNPAIPPPSRSQSCAAGVDGDAASPTPARQRGAE